MDHDLSQSPAPAGLIFDAALEVPKEQRAGYLDKACAGDAPLRRRVEALLRAHEEAGGFMENPAQTPRLSAVDQKIGRYLHNEPVAARPPSPGYRFQKMVRRNKLAFAAGSAVVVALIFGLGVSTLSVIRTKNALRRALVAENTLTDLRQEAMADAQKTKALLAKFRFSEADRLIQADHGPEAVAYLSAILSAAPGDYPALNRLASLLTYHRWMTPTFSLNRGRWVVCVQFSPDGTRLATGSSDEARVWDAQTGQPLTGPMLHRGQISTVQFSPDGLCVLTASSDNTARVWDAQTGQPLSDPLVHDDALFSARFSPDGRRMVTAGRDHTARVWDVGFAPSTCPDWLLPLAEALAGARLSQDGILESTTLDRAQTIAQIRQNLQTRPESEDGVAWGRWLLADPSARAISPFAK